MCRAIRRFRRCVKPPATAMRLRFSTNAEGAGQRHFRERYLVLHGCDAAGRRSTVDHREGKTYAIVTATCNERKRAIYFDSAGRGRDRKWLVCKWRRRMPSDRLSLRSQSMAA